MDLARFTAALLPRWATCRAKKRSAPHLALGRRGERLAASFLRREHHFKVLYRNFRCAHGGEIDLVCRDRAANALVFVEVKTRRSDAFGPLTSPSRWPNGNVCSAVHTSGSACLTHPKWSTGLTLSRSSWMRVPGSRSSGTPLACRTTFISKAGVNFPGKRLNRPHLVRARSRRTSCSQKWRTTATFVRKLMHAGNCFGENG